MGTVLDTNFDYMVTTKLIKLFYRPALGVISLAAVVMVWYGLAFLERNTALGVMTLLFTPVTWLFLVLAMRVVLEFLINQFKISEYLRPSVPGMGARARLDGLASQLRAQGFTVEVYGRGLEVSGSVAGCGAEVPLQGETVTCRPRIDDGQRLWFFSSSQEPISEADRITEAVTAIKGHLGAPS